MSLKGPHDKDFLFSLLQLEGGGIFKVCGLTGGLLIIENVPQK